MRLGRPGDEADPAARHDIPAWCRMRDHELVELTEIPQSAEMSEMSENTDFPKAPATDGSPSGGQYLRFVVLLRAQRPKAGGIGSGSEPSSRAR